MDIDTRVLERLGRYEELLEQGTPITPEELCEDSPELLGEVKRRIDDLKAVRGMLNESAEQGETETMVPGETGKPAESDAVRCAGRFVLRDKHAEGGLGEVFRAVDTELNRDVALKRIKASRPSDDSCRRFLVEGEVTGRLEHPGVVPVYGLGHDSLGRPFYAMRFVRGETLRDAIERFHAPGASRRMGSGERSKALRELLGQFVAVCNTIGYAHSRGILHRDLKPANILLGPYGETLVVDWGLAKPFERDDEARSAGEETLQPGSGDDCQQTQQGQAVGTPQYMSPEQAAGGRQGVAVGPASDVYSLGATLYHLLTGVVPFEGRKVGELLGQVQSGTFASPRKRNAAVPRPLEAICLKAMALSPDKRHPSALELAADVKSWLADEPVAAWREPWRVRTWRWLRRHPVLVTGSVAALLLAAVVTASIGFVLAAQERELQAEAEATLKTLAANRANDRAELVAQHARKEVIQALDDAEQRHTALYQELGDPLRAHRLLSDIDDWDRTVKDARKAWQRARGLAAGSKDMLAPEILARLDRMDSVLTRDEADYRLARQLDDIRLQAGIFIDGRVDSASAAPKYRDAFRAAKFDVMEGQPAEVASQIAAAPLRYVLTAALDHWAVIVKTEKELDRILELARLTDPDPWRNQVRDWSGYRSVHDPKRGLDPAYLKNLQQMFAKMEELAAAVRPEQHSPQTLVLLSLRLSFDQDKAAAFLRAAVREHPRDFWLYFTLGETVEDPVERAGYFRAALAIRPNSTVARFNLGSALLEKKDLEGAFLEYRKASELDGRASMPHLGLGNVLSARKDLNGAIKEYRKAIDIDSKNVFLRVILGNTLLMTGHREEAIREFRKALELDPNLALAHSSLGNAFLTVGLEEALREYRKALELDPQCASAHLGLGNVLHLRKDVDGASQAFGKAISAYMGQDNSKYGPKSMAAVPCSRLGDILYAKGELDEAERQYRKAVELDPTFADAYGGLGLILREKKDLKGAIRELSKAIELDPKVALHHLNLGSTLLMKGHREECIREYRKAIELDPNLALAHSSLGNALLLEDLDEALRECRKALELDPQFAQGHLVLGTVLYARKDLDGASQAFGKAISAYMSQDGHKYGPKSMAAVPCSRLGDILYAKGELDEAERQYRKAIKLDPTFADAYGGLGLILRDKKDLKGAIRELSKAIELDPKVALHHLNLGHTLLRNRDREEGIREIRKAIELDPNIAVAHCILGVAFEAKMDLDEAVRAYRKALELDPQYALAHLYLARVLYVKKDLNGASLAFQNAIKFDPKSAESYSGLGDVLREMKDAAGAIQAYRQAVALDPNNPSLHNGLGNALDDKRDFEGAARAYRKAIELDPKNAHARNGLGNALANTNLLDEAIQQYRKAIELDPKFADPHNGLGNALSIMKKLDEALEEFRKGIALNPNNAYPHNRMARVLFEKKDLDRAIQEYRKAIELDPKDPIPHNNLGEVLYEKKDSQGAIKEYRQAIQLDADYADAHSNLSLALRYQGEFGEALKHARIVQKLEKEAPAAANSVKELEKLCDLDRRLPAVLDGKEKVEAGVLADMAEMCTSYKKSHVKALHLYERAFKQQPALQDDLDKQHRYSAACAAALAGRGQGDAAKLDDAARAKLRLQARGWLRDDLALYARNLKKGPPEAPIQVAERMKHWQQDADLEGIRETKELAKLPAKESQECRKLWADVRQTLKAAEARIHETRLQGTLTPKEKSATHEFKMVAGKTYVLDLESTDFDTFLKLQDAKGKLLAENDDISPENLNSRLIFAPTVDGSYRLMATSFQEQGSGAYTLRIREVAQNPKD